MNMNVSLETQNVVKSWLNVFLAAVLTAVLTSIATDVWDWRAILFAGLVAVLPVIRNWLNPNDPRYGRGFEDPNANPIVVDVDDTDGMAG